MTKTAKAFVGGCGGAKCQKGHPSAQRRGEAENGPGKTRYDLVPHWPDPRFWA
jgi:hypothetical protein